MKRVIRSSTILGAEENVINITLILRPVFSKDSVIFGSVNRESDNKGNITYHTDVNPSRIINGPLSQYGKKLPPNLATEYDMFTKDCAWLVKETGFTVISEDVSEKSKKSKYIVMFGVDDTPCGSLVFDLRLSDHPFDTTFPEDKKEEALKYLQDHYIIDGTATKANIDFTVEGLLIGICSTDSWDRAFGRLQHLLSGLRHRIRARINIRQPSRVVAIPLNSKMCNVLYDNGTKEELRRRHLTIPQTFFVEIVDGTYFIDLCITDDGYEFALSEFMLNPMDVPSMNNQLVHIDATLVDRELGGIGIERDFANDTYRLWQILS